MPDDTDNLDRLIAEYLEQVDEGRVVHPEEFIAAYPEHRSDFLQFVAHAELVHRIGESRDEPFDDYGSFVSLNGEAAGVDGKAAGLNGGFPGLGGESALRKQFCPGDFPPSPPGYCIRSLIGQGGMGTVYAATRLSDDSVVALKILNYRQTTDSVSVQRCLREARVVSSLSHDHIVPLYAVEQSRNAPVLVMMLVDGVTLADIIQQSRLWSSQDQSLTLSVQPGDLSQRQVAEAVERVEKPVHGECGQASDVTSALTPLSACSARACLERACGSRDYFSSVCLLMADIARALASSHEMGVVHRDIKPSNILLDAEGKAWLTDFGLASLQDDPVELTGTGDLLGTPAYMSPEQAAGKTRMIDHRSDVYALGATLYELVTLRRPFVGNRHQVLADVLEGNLQLPSRYRTGVPSALEAIIVQAMSVQPASRYQSARDLADDLVRFASGKSVMARTPGLADRILRWTGRHPRTAISCVVGGVALLLSIVIIQLVVSFRLAGVNRTQSETNQQLASINGQLAKTNSELHSSQLEIQHHLYVSDMSAAYRAFAQGDVDTTRQLLQRAGEGKGDPSEQAFEWKLLDALTQRTSLHDIAWHTASAMEVVVIPGKHQILSVYADGLILKHDLRTLNELARFQVEGRLDAVAVSPDATLFAVGQNVVDGLNPVTLRDLESGEVVRQLKGHENSVDSIAFSPDGKLVATAGRYSDVFLQSVDGGDLLFRFSSGSRNETVSFSGDGRSLMVCERLTKPDLPNFRDQKVRTWRLSDLSNSIVLPSDFMAITFAVAKESTRVLIADGDQLAMVDQATGVSLGSRTNLRGRIRCVALLDGGDRAAAGCDNGLLYIWDTSEGLPEVFDPEGQTHQATVVDTGIGGINGLAFLRTGQLVVAKADGRIQLADPPVQNPSVRYSKPILSAVQSPVRPSCLFARLTDGTVVRFDDLGNPAVSESFSSGDSREPVVLLKQPVDVFGRMAVSAAEEWIAFSSPQELIVACCKTGEILARRPLPFMDKLPCDLCFSADQSMLMILLTDRVLVYRVADWHLCKETLLPNESASRLVVAPDGASVVVVTYSELIQLDAAYDVIEKRLPTNRASFSTARFSTSGCRLVVGYDDGTVEVLDAATWKSQAILRGHRAQVSEIRFINCDQTLLTISNRGVIRIWDMWAERELGILFDENPQLFVIEDKNLAITCGADHPLRIWSVEQNTARATSPDR